MMDLLSGKKETSLSLAADGDDIGSARCLPDFVGESRNGSLAFFSDYGLENRPLILRLHTVTS